MKYFFSIILFLIVQLVYGQTTTPKREFRGAWIATIGNIDWPSKQGLDATMQQQEFIALIDQMKDNGLNAAIVQIRPCADALYDSPFENWSKYLSGKQGVPPTPYYDPLEFMINECHKRCIEFHAWFNPYRALVDANKNLNTATHCTNTHPNWFLNYGGKKYFDPGLPEVREYFTNIVLDVVKRYDVDAIHFDDYFYPYRIAKQEFPDFKSYAKYGSNFPNKDDWRRNNVNTLIESLSKKIKKEKPYVKFGISPFGVWRNSSKDPEGSVTNGGQTNYDDLFADILLWLRKGWIDYALPQLYWEQGHHAADYDELINWWSRHAYGKNMYVGHALYQIGTSTKACWRSLNEMNEQVALTRTTPGINGSSFYSANSFKKNCYGLNEDMKNNWYKTPSLLPSMPWIDSIPPASPKVESTITTNGFKQLNWTVSNPKQETLQFAIYRFEKGEQANISASHLITIIRDNSYIDYASRNKKYKYFITALDRLQNESSVSNVVE